MLRIARKRNNSTASDWEAINFFGPDGLKLSITGPNETEISFEAGEGFVTVAAGVKKGKTAVEFTTANGNLKWNSLS